MKRSVLAIFFFLAFFTLLTVESVMANNVRIPEAPILHSRGGVDVTGTPGTVYIQFPLRWENSWRSNRPNNYDGVWIYAKAWDGDKWVHVYLSADSTRHHFGRGAGVLHRQITANCEIGTVMQPENENLMNIEIGFSNAQRIGIDANENWTREAVGVFIYRVGTGRGTVNLTSVNLFWEYEKQGFYRDDQLAVKVFAIEMVFVPEGHFYVGCSGTDANWAGNTFTSNASLYGNPFRIDSEDSIRLRESADPNELWAVGMSTTATWHTGVGTIPRAFPKGYRAFWIMKHELTQEAYADFLNTLTFAQQDAHCGSRDANGNSTRNLSDAIVGGNPWNNTANALWQYRNHIVVTQIGDNIRFGVNARLLGAGTSTVGGVTGVSNFSGVVPRNRYDGEETELVGIDGQDLPVNFVSWFNLLGFAEFAGLRPMTELEFEKASRGPIFPVPGEFAWGSVLLNEVQVTWNVPATNGTWATAINASLTAMFFNSGDERFADGRNSSGAIQCVLRRTSGVAWGATAISSGVRSVRRVGLFATANTNREGSGATFWGVLDMSDNVNEMVVNATHSVGFAFTAHHGAGNLRGDGELQDMPGRVWPTAQGSFYPRGFRVAQSEDNGRVTNGGSTWAAATSANFNMAVTWNAGRTSNRSRVSMHYHFKNNNPIRYQGGIRLVRTQYWLQTSKEAVAAAVITP